MLLQNTASVSYMGLRQGLEEQERAGTEPAHAAVPGLPGDGRTVLRQLFALADPQLLPYVLEVVAQGRTYQGGRCWPWWWWW